MVLLPLYNLINDATPSKRLPQYESPRNPKPFLSHAQYYFAAAMPTEDETDKDDVPPYPLFYFSQTVDAPRLRYALSLFLSLLAVEPAGICVHLASTYMAHSSGYSSPVTPTNEPSPAISSHNINSGKVIESPDGRALHTKSARPERLHSSVAKSLLELILTNCSHLLLTDYSSRLDLSVNDMIALTSIKITSVNLIVNVLECITRVASGLDRHPCTDGSNLTNSTYVLCLLALCEVQKSTLLGLLQLVDIFKNVSATKRETDSMGDKATESYSLYVSLPYLQPLYLQLLKALYYGICLESMATNIAESPINLRKSRKEQLHNEDSKILSYVPGTSLVMQPLFYHILNSILSRTHLVLQQMYLLSTIGHSMVHFRESLEVIAPKLLKQIYRNLKELLTEKDQARRVECTKGNTPSPDLTRKDSTDGGSWGDSSDSCVCQSNELIAVYMRTISYIVHYCLLRTHGKSPSPSSHRIGDEKTVLHFQLVDPFSNLPIPPPPSIGGGADTPSISSTPTQEKGGFSFGWLFGGVFNGTEPEKQDVKRCGEYCGVYAPVGQKVLWQLQHVYGVVVRVWRESCSTDNTVSTFLRNVS